MNKSIPKIWESLLNSGTPMPVIMHSFERIFDSKYYAEEASVHDQFELVYLQKGRAIFDSDGESISLKEREIMLLKPLMPHKLILNDSGGCSVLVIKFSFSAENKNISQVSMNDFINFISSPETGKYISIGSSQNYELVQCMHRIMSESRENDEFSTFLSSILAMEMFVYLSRILKNEWEACFKSKDNKLKELLREAKEYIEHNYYNDINLTGIAGYIYLSSGYFVRAFKKQYDISPIQYLLTMRINKAKELLLQTDRKIGDIAIDVGFSAQQRFNDIFKKQTGKSPSAYRDGI